MKTEAGKRLQTARDGEREIYIYICTHIDTKRVRERDRDTETVSE